MGSSIDVSSTGQLVNKLLNPPNMGDQFAKGLDALNAWKQFQANQAVADAYKQSVDPVTGAFDQNKFNALASQGPGAWQFGDTMRSAGAGFGAQSQATTADVQSKMAQLGAVGQFMTPLAQRIANGEHISGAEAQANLDQAHKMGLINDQLYGRVSGEIAQIPQGGNADGIIRGAVIGNESAMHSMAPHYEGAGGYIFQTAPFARGGNPAAGPVVTTTPTPGEMIGTTVVPIGNNQSATVPNWVAARGGEAIRQWLEATKPPGYTPGSYQPAPPAGGATLPGRYPQPAAPVQPPGSSAPASSNAPLWLQPPTRGTTPVEAGGPGVTSTTQYGEGVSATTKEASAAAGSLGSQAGETQNTIATLNDMERTLNQPGVTTGVGAQSITGFRQLLMNAGIVPKDSATPDLSTAQGAQEEFNKDSALLQKSQLGTIGNPTDARQDLVAEATPGSALSKTGNLGIIRMLRGNQQAINVMNNAWNQARQKAGWTAGGSEANNFNAWRSQFLAPDKTTDGGKFDSRVFWIANAPTIAEQREYAATIPKEQQQQFLKNLAYATNMGWVAKGADGSVQLQGQ